MVWTTPRTWAASEVPTSTNMNLHIRDNLLAINGFVSKTADESVTSSTALQNDDHLALTIGGAGTYVIDFNLIATSAANAAGDISIGFTFPAGTAYFSGIGPDTSLASGNSVVGNFQAGATTTGATTTSYGLSTSTLTIQCRVLFIATASGTFQLRWAQLASNANATTMKTGSQMTMRQVS